MKYLTLTFFAVWSLSALAQPPKSIEIRFCPASAIRTYPLASRRDLQGLLLQNVAVINHEEAPFKVDNIDIELLQLNRVVVGAWIHTSAFNKVSAAVAKSDVDAFIGQRLESAVVSGFNDRNSFSHCICNRCDSAACRK